jgi:hypothetical protein
MLVYAIFPQFSTASIRFDIDKENFFRVRSLFWRLVD